MRPFLPSSKLEFRRVVSNTVLKGVCTVDAPGAGNAMTRRVPFARICTVSCLYSAVFGGHTPITFGVHCAFLPGAPSTGYGGKFAMETTRLLRRPSQ
ncbi:hypothetical protein TcBrA4_0051970 [Trypanosoma cruzi]|nr:hypothetical protein TcBrA4_0051970 [Trypanosoma cruzi]